MNKMKKCISLFALLTLFACGSNQNDTPGENPDPNYNGNAGSNYNENTGPNYSGHTEPNYNRDTEPVEVEVETFMAEIDKQAMDEIIDYSDVDGLSTIEIYNQPIQEVEKWTDKFWGRCCTEADMTFSEYISYGLSVSKEGKEYPFEYALDEYYNTAYVFEEKDEIVISVKFNDEIYMYDDGETRVIDAISAKDTLITPFRISIINGYVKSEKTFKENGRIKEVELWLNGEHRCNCVLQDVPDPQVIKGNFPFFKNDHVEIKPISFYPGSKYDDICISALQRNLGAITHPDINKNYSIWDN